MTEFGASTHPSDGLFDVRLVVNGVERQLKLAPWTTLLDALPLPCHSFVSASTPLWWHLHLKKSLYLVVYLTPRKRLYMSFLLR